MYNSSILFNFLNSNINSIFEIMFLPKFNFLNLSKYEDKFDIETIGKITGMILENDLEILSDIINKPMELKEQIDKGHELIINMS